MLHFFSSLHYVTESGVGCFHYHNPLKDREKKMDCTEILYIYVYTSYTYIIHTRKEFPYNKTSEVLLLWAMDHWSERRNIFIGLNFGFH